jgi:catechol 2,3-dioxygenase-like lactoylglutathione lyase family enzyme
MHDTTLERDAFGRMSRRALLMTVPGLLAAPRLWAQGGGALKARALNHMTLSVSDPKQSLDFYQGLFGMPIQARQGATTLLRIGAGPQFMALSAAGSNPPSINHYCLTVDDFNVDRILQTLAAHGVTKAEAAGGGLSGGPMKVRVRMRGPESGGAKEGTPELYVGDPDGIVVQLQDPRYGGGAGVLGDVLKVEPSQKKGLLAVKDLSHFTISVSDAQRSNAFYQKLFGFSTVQFLMFTGGGGGARAGAPAAPPRPASINHVCLSMENFNTDQLTRTLEGYGIKPRPANTPAGPMQWYISMRMENRGGAKEGTPEFYFTDPDGIPIQLQDVSYCGGGGYLGNVCPA